MPVCTAAAEVKLEAETRALAIVSVELDPEEIGGVDAIAELDAEAGAETTTAELDDAIAEVRVVPETTGVADAVYVADPAFAHTETTHCEAI